ncbi:MAG: hypothetical protein U5R06_04355 [candidate division KSB1 bacterium]|nr:hypothetical protein [candidate division KSB1 bacterium]
MRLGVHLFKNQFTQRSKGRREKQKRYSGLLLSAGFAPRRALFQKPIHAKQQRSLRKVQKIFRFSFSAALRLGVHLFKNQFTQRSKGRREKRKRYSGFLSLSLRLCASACIVSKTNSRKEAKVAEKSAKDIPVFFLSLCGFAPLRALFKNQFTQRSKGR